MHTAVTVSDLLYQLGDIPASRVRLQPAPGTATEADVVTVHDREADSANWWMVCWWRRPWGTTSRTWRQR